MSEHTVVPRIDPEHVRAVVYGTNAEVQERFRQHFGVDIERAVEDLGKGYHEFQDLQDQVKLDEHCAEVQLFIHTAYNSLISSLHLLVSGYPVGSGHLMRHFVESIAMALMCSDLRIGVYQAYAANRKHFDMASAPDRLKQKPVRRILESALGFDSDAWETVLHLAPHAQAPPNTRLKLTAPVVGGRIAFVIIPARRRSLSAIR